MKQNRSLTDAQLEALLFAATEDAATYNAQRKATRLRTIILLMADAGLRVGEVTRLTWSHVFFQGEPKDPLDIPAEIAKRAHPRSIPLTPRLAAQLLDHQHAWSAQHYPDYKVYLIHNTQPSNRLSPRAIERTLATLGERTIGIPVWPHLLRHTFANRIRRQTDLPTLQNLLGHKHLSSTQVYADVDDHDRRKAIEAINPTTEDRSNP